MSDYYNIRIETICKTFFCVNIIALWVVLFITAYRLGEARSDLAYIIESDPTLQKTNERK